MINNNKEVINPLSQDIDDQDGFLDDEKYQAKVNMLFKNGQNINVDNFPNFQQKLLDEFAVRFKNFRILTGLTQKEFAELVNIKQTQLSFYENGVYLPSDEVMKKICFAFSIPYNELKYGNDNMIDIKLENANIPINEDPGATGLNGYGRLSFEQQPLAININYEYFPYVEKSTVCEFNAQAYMIYQKLLNSNPETLNIVSDFLTRMDNYFDYKKFYEEKSKKLEQLEREQTHNKKTRKLLNEFKKSFDEEPISINIVPLLIHLGCSEKKAKLLNFIISSAVELADDRKFMPRALQLFFEPFFDNGSLSTLEDYCLSRLLGNIFITYLGKYDAELPRINSAISYSTINICSEYKETFCCLFEVTNNLIKSSNIFQLNLAQKDLERLIMISNTVQDYFILRNMYRDYSVFNDMIIVRNWYDGNIRFTDIKKGEIEGGNINVFY